MTILEKREMYKPFEYPEFYSAWETVSSQYWSPFEVQLGGDIMDWKTKLTDTERYVISSVLLGFVQSEVLIGCYWRRMADILPKAETAALCTTFSFFEVLHQYGYQYLQTTLGLEETFGDYLKDKAAKERLDRLVEIRTNTPEEIAQSIAIFSAFGEGVSLFSNFAVLNSFQRRNLLKGVNTILRWSIRDEQTHAKYGMLIFNILRNEYPNILTDFVKKNIYDAARLTIQLEDAFIDKAFEMGPIEGIDSRALKAYIRYRANSNLNEIGLKSNWKNIDKGLLAEMEWFSIMNNSISNSDFFAAKEIQYSRGALDFSDIFKKDA